ncbi:MAG: hypothetical protein XD50_0944 [Clostridia bacterium 41_269]|nr:MAG: hypothetical protein XD50_0944 [Clostridia bacterium 41_269]
MVPFDFLRRTLTNISTAMLKKLENTAVTAGLLNPNVVFQENFLTWAYLRSHKFIFKNLIITRYTVNTENLLFF